MKRLFVVATVVLVVGVTMTLAANVPTLSGPGSGQGVVPPPEFAVLWDQPLSAVNQNAYINQAFGDFPTFSSYLADDFVVPAQGWSIESIFVPSNGWNGATTIACGPALTFQIYADNAGIPGGDPSGGGNPPLWTLTVPPTDPQITITNGSGGIPTNVLATLAAPVQLTAGTYWLIFFPTADFATCGQFGRQPADTTSGTIGYFINPGGGVGYGTAWQPWTILGPTEHDIAFRLEGTVGGGPQVPNINVSPLSLASTQPPDTVTQQTMTITNTGGTDLTWLITEQPVLKRAVSAPTPAGNPKSLSGTYVTFDPSVGGDTCFMPSTLGTFCFRAESFTNDYEYVYNVWQRFPADWTVTNVSVQGTPTCTGGGTWGTFGWSFQTAPFEVNIAHSRYQLTTDHCTAYYCFDVTAGAGPADAGVSWYWDGDGYANPPHNPCSSDGYTPAGQNACDEIINPAAMVPSCGVTDVPWLSSSPITGTIPPAGSQLVDVTFDSTGLAIGSYAASLVVTSNDPDPGPGNGTDLVEVPVTLNVSDALGPAIELNKTVGVVPGVCAATDSITVSTGTSVYYCFVVENTGDVTFNYHNLVDDHLGVILNNFPYTLAPGAFSPEVIVPSVASGAVVNTGTWEAADVVGGYAVDDTIAYNFEDISGTGTPLALTDDSTASFPIGFTFDYYGGAYTSFFVSSNGFLSDVD